MALATTSCAHFSGFLKNDIERDRPARDVKTLKGTRALHHIKSTGTEGTLQARHLACCFFWCQNRLSNTGDCVSTEIVDLGESILSFPMKSVPMPNPSPFSLCCHSLIHILCCHYNLSGTSRHSHIWTSHCCHYNLSKGQPPQPQPDQLSQSQSDQLPSVQREM